MDARTVNIIVLISANIEWQVVKEMLADVEVQSSPFGEWFLFTLDIDVFIEGTKQVMSTLLNSLPQWIAHSYPGIK